MKPSLRQVVADTHIAAIAIAMLLLWSLVDAFALFVLYIPGVVDYVTTIFIEHRIPFSFSVHAETAILVQYFGSSLADLAAASLLAHWVFRAGPIKSLLKSAAALRAASHV